LLMLSADPRRRVGRFAELAAVATLGLSGPLIVFFVPWFVWRWRRTRSRHSLAVVIVAVAAALVQARSSCSRIAKRPAGTCFICRGCGSSASG
jgi:hypothetical protein